MPRHFDLDLLETFIAITETGSLSGAAVRVGRSQSAVSEQVRKLEDMCGVKLFERGKLGAAVTPAGERLERHARELIAASRAAYLEMRGVQLSGVVRFAITDYFRPRALPEILRRVRDRYPRLRLDVSICKSADIEDETRASEFDIGLSMSVLGGRRANAKPAGRLVLRREPLSWIADKAFVMPKRAALPLVVLSETCSLRRLVIKRLDDKGVVYTVAHSTSGVGGLHLAIAAGLGVTCINASAVPDNAAALSEARLPTMPEVEFAFVAPRTGEPPVVAEIRAMLAEQLG